MPKNNSKNTGSSNNINFLDIAAKKLMSTIDTSYSERDLLSEKDNKIQQIINNELDLAKGISNGSIIDFVATMAKDSAKANGRDPNEVDGYSLFTEDIGNIFGYFQELYRNRYIELNDLKFITKFIPAIGEAVKTTLDTIVGSDDFSTSITRNLIFNASLTDIEKSTVIAEIERIERDNKLLKKLRNIVYNKTLVSGTHYVYCIPYADLFEEYDRLVKSGKLDNNMLVNNALARNPARKNVKKSKGFNIDASESSIVMESYSIDEVVESITPFIGKDQISKVKDIVNENLSDVTTCDSDVLLEALEGFTSAQLMKQNLTNYRDTFSGNAVLEDKEILVSSDGTYDPNIKGDKFNTQGAYIKYIDATKMVPVKVYTQIIGYLHVHDTSANKKATTINKGSETNLIASTSNLFSSVNLSEQNRNAAVQSIVSTITDGILSNFSNKFVNKNAEFKKMIADCIVSNGLVNTAYQIQFIPAKYIVSFTVNENEDELGTSILQDSLFPAKMLLSLLVSKLLTYMNKTGNKTIAYVRKGPLDVSTSNHVQRVIRMMQESQITFSDLLSTNLSFAKFSRNGNIQLPMARNGDRLIDFETQEGQDVDMNTPMEEYLEKLAILGTGVPSTIMEYTDAADYSRSIVSGNLKFASRVSTLQSDLEEPTTELYKKLLATSNLSDELKAKAISQFEFKLCRPRVLTNSNMADYLSQIQSITDTLSTLVIGQDDENPDANKIKQKFNLKIASKLLPFLEIDDYLDMAKQASIEVVKEKDFDANKSSEDDTSEDDEFL